MPDPKLVALALSTMVPLLLAHIADLRRQRKREREQIEQLQHGLIAVKNLVDKPDAPKQISAVVDGLARRYHFGRRSDRSPADGKLGG